jgi:hypothetical protein
MNIIFVPSCRQNFMAALRKRDNQRRCDQGAYTRIRNADISAVGVLCFTRLIQCLMVLDSGRTAVALFHPPAI